MTTVGENPAIDEMDRYNDEQGSYSEWFHDNLEDNIEAYCRYEVGGDKEKQFKEYERLTDIYNSEGYGEDEDFEAFCSNGYEEEMSKYYDYE